MSMPSKPRLLKRLCALGLTAAMTVSGRRARLRRQHSPRH